MPDVVVPAKENPFHRWCNLAMIAKVLKVIWEMPVYLYACAKAEDGEDH